MTQESHSSHKLNPPSIRELSEIQKQAILELDSILHPAILSSFVQTSTRQQWKQLGEYVDALKQLLQP